MNNLREKIADSRNGEISFFLFVVISSSSRVSLYRVYGMTNGCMYEYRWRYQHKIRSSVQIGSSIFSSSIRNRLKIGISTVFELSAHAVPGKD